MRYLLKFYKEGYIRYTSHLDILRLFNRSFKRVGIKLQYSNGFNPHPKMSFAQPLSLGYLSTSEYLDFETIEEFKAEEIKEKLNAIMPQGLGIIECNQIPSGGKTMAAMVEYSDYEIIIPCTDKTPQELSTLVADFLSQKQIIIKKLQRKSGKVIETDIRPMIFQLKIDFVDNNNIMLVTQICAGSVLNLSPENLITAFSEFASIEFDRAEVKSKRTEIYCKKGTQIVPLGNYFSQ